MDLSAKVVFITGGAQGVGRALAEAALAKGAKVCICDINANQGETTVTELRKKWGHDNAYFVKCDVTDSLEFENCFRDVVTYYGNVDVMVNNAGILHETNWQTCIDINFTGSVRGTMLALEHMRKDRGGVGGVIVNISSTAGLGPGYWLPVYCATKSAILNFTESWAASPDVKSNGVKLVVVCPGGVQTAMFENVSNDQLYHKDVFMEYANKVGFCQVEVVAAAFIKAVETPDNNGAIYRVTKSTGIERVQRSTVVVDDQL